tara:strand:- start:20 stop:1291 length:1272 start_codon:yes stop_codon:yes gene_type:complete
MDHLLVRRIAGFRVAAIVFLAISTITLIKSIFVPSYGIEFLNQCNLLLNLLTMISFGYIYQNLNEKNYNTLVILGLGTALIYYVSLETMNSYNIRLQNLSEIGSGRSLDYQFLAPLFFVVAHTLFFRKSIMYFAIIVYSGALVLNVYEILTKEMVFLSISWAEIVADGNAINLPFFGIWVNIYVTIVIMCWAIVFLTDRLLDDAVRFEKSTKNLSRYFSPTIRDKIKEQDILVDKANDRSQAVAILFTDIDGFTKLSDTMPPDEIIKLLSEYQEKMVKPIFENMGTVDKFIGDAVMATFGTPVSQGNDAQNAFECARQMQIAMNQWAKERANAGLPVITHRIGIHYGECIVGNIGTEERKEYTVIGDAVNVASRICDTGKTLKATLVFSNEVKVRLLEDVRARVEEKVQLKGKDEKITLFCLD